MKTVLAILLLTFSTQAFAECPSVEKTLRDRQGRLLGQHDVTSDRITLRDAQGRLLGSYRCSSNRTEDAQGRLVGSGNLLASLLK